MSWFTGSVVYLLIWWVVLFAVLPLGAQPASDRDPHTGWSGAPAHPRMLRTVAITTLVAAVIWCGADLLISSDYLSFRHGMFAAPND